MTLQHATLPVSRTRATGARALPAVDEESLWLRYWAERDRSLRNELLLCYQHLTGQAVGRLPSAIRLHWDSDDLASFATLGLVEAIERFEEGSIVNRFPSYATSRIRGAIFDELRRLDWLPRTVRRRVITYRSTAEALSSELGRTPASREVLAEMGAEPVSGHQILREVQSAQLAQLDAPVDGGRGDVATFAEAVEAPDSAPDQHLLAEEERAQLREAVLALPERQRTVVSLHLLGGLTQEQIGAMLGVSNSRVCQIEAVALQTLRRTLGALRI
ncbi:MAG TPA: sigma-70 family RNA polymerase sigma factor [Acidimicrobiales bacterium]|nr:sigma-70 family RNA polymerase sigma factor [Acidimicrobiales bacterium]